jgi:hypothetical protein
MVGFLAGGDSALAAARDVVEYVTSADVAACAAKGLVYSLKAVTLKALVPRPTKLILVGLNYRDHAELYLSRSLSVRIYVWPPSRTSTRFPVRPLLIMIACSGGVSTALSWSRILTVFCCGLPAPPAPCIVTADAPPVRWLRDTTAWSEFSLVSKPSTPIAPTRRTAFLLQFEMWLRSIVTRQTL